MPTRKTVEENIRYYTLEAQKAAARGLTATAAAYERLIASNITKLAQLDAQRCARCGQPATENAYGVSCDQWPNCKAEDTK